METLIWTGPGLGQYYIRLWGRSYLGVGRRASSRTWQKLCQEKTQVYSEGNLTIEEYTYGITRRGIRPYGHLAQYRGWPETRASKHQNWAWRQTAPPSLTAGVLGGFHQGSPSGELNWGRKKGARIPGWGGMMQQAWHRPVLPAHYLLPNTREETGSTRRL